MHRLVRGRMSTLKVCPRLWGWQVPRPPGGLQKVHRVSG